MAPYAKYVAIYDTPFWRDEGLCGGARSGRGPMGEIHDASVPGGPAALFGFLGVPAAVRRGVTEDELRTHCRAQLGRLFGERAAAPPKGADEGAWAGRLAGIGSEWSRDFPGYLAGAAQAAIEGVREAVARLG